MAIVFEQGLAKQSGIAVGSVNASFALTPTAGNLIIVVVSSFVVSGSPGILTVADNQGNSYAVDADSNGGSQSAAIASGKAVTASGTFTVTVTFNSSATTVDWSMMEISGLAAASWLDRTGITSSFSADPVVVTASGANTQASEFVAAVAMPTAGAISGTPSTSYFDLYTDAVSTGGRGSYKTISGIETSSASFPYATANGAYLAIATYKAITSSSSPITSSNILRVPGPRRTMIIPG